MNREQTESEPLLTQSVTIDGSLIRYGIHRGGLRNGHLHTLIGDFASMDELERYVRGRNGTKDPSGGPENSPDSRYDVWPGLYYLPHEHGTARRQEPE